MKIFNRRLNLMKKPALAVTAVYGLFLSFFMFYGLDVLDSGFSLSKQWSMYNGMWAENFDFLAGTNLIGGLWLSIPGKPLLLWARLGFLIIQIMTIFVSYRMMELFFKPKDIVPVFIPVSLFLATWHLYYTINYDNLSYLFGILSLYFILRSLKKQKFERSGYIISGMLIMLAAFCKITYFAAFAFPVYLIFLSASADHSVRTKDKLFYFFYGILISGGLIVLFLYFSGGLQNYSFHFFDIIYEFITPKQAGVIRSHDHSFQTLFLVFREDMKSVVEEIYKYVLLILVYVFLIKKVGKLKIIKYSIASAGFIVLFYFIFEKNRENLYTGNTLRYMISFFLSLYVLLLFSDKRHCLKNNLLLIFSGAGLFFYSFLGSDLGFRAAFHTGSGLILFAVPVIILKKCSLRIKGQTVKFGFVYFFILISFLFSSIYKKDNIYREPEFKYITEPFKTPSLAGIKSNPDRVAVVDSLLAYLESIPELKSKNILFTHSNPLMYYLTGTNYPLDHPWDILNDYYDLERRLNEIKPDLIVIPKVSHRFRTWPSQEAEHETGYSTFKKYYEAYDKIIEELLYDEIYSNSFYTVYAFNTKESEQ